MTAQPKDNLCNDGITDALLIKQPKSLVMMQSKSFSTPYELHKSQVL